ncbi:MAG: hypothetical protein ABI806_24375 [Candidatus Solibacter sp.]
MMRKASLVAAGIFLLDACSVYFPSVFGWANLVHHDRAHADVVAVQCGFWLALAIALRRPVLRLPHR